MVMSCISILLGTKLCIMHTHMLLKLMWIWELSDLYMITTCVSINFGIRIRI
jgi:hypothetical protein